MRQIQRSANNIDGIIKKDTSKLAIKTVQKRLVVAAVLAVVFIIFLGFLVRHLMVSPKVNLDSVESIKTTINRHFLLPTDEEPALATVTDTSKLTSVLQENAKNGDRVLIYQNHHQAILYRPSIDRVVAVTTVSIDTPQGAKN